MVTLTVYNDLNELMVWTNILLFVVVVVVVVDCLFVAVT